MTKKQKIDYRIVVTGLVCITALELYSLNQGMNGTLLKTVLVAIALAIGITIPTPKLK